MSDSLFDLSRKKRAKEQAPAKSSAKDDVLERLESMRKQHHELVDKIAETYHKSGVDAKELAKFCQNPDNFTPFQWEQFKTRKEQMETRITGLTSEKLRKSKEAKAVSRGAKERRGKTLGARKKWLNMR